MLTPVAPVNVTHGLYRIDTPAYSISHPDIECRKDGTVVTCTTPVAGKDLTIVLDTARTEYLRCEASYDGKPLACARTFDYGPGSGRVRLDTSLGVSAEQAADLRAAVPWWTALIDGDWITAALGLLAALAVTSGLLAWFWSGTPRPATPRRLTRTAVTAVLAWTFPTVSGAVLAPVNESLLFVLFIPHSVVIPAVMMATWQWSAGGAITGAVGQRVRHVALAVVATLVYGAAMTLWLSIAAGFPD
ncbi:hypothetical protein [Alloactinosynnema sp. L-07]|uniref:hypothetical protein n=1 Tax=Alloactinosynnema sp. L-07 TaxID=1653480 RepID=UPI0006B43646|nr:hypothetical protein [Alloactinosynnema sp. L-07]